MRIKSILTTTVTFEYDGDLNEINIQQYIENEYPINEEVKHKIIIEE